MSDPSKESLALRRWVTSAHHPGRDGSEMIESQREEIQRRLRAFDTVLAQLTEWKWNWQLATLEDVENLVREMEAAR